MPRSRVTFEGSIPLTFGPSGKGKGPASRSPVFYNPAMRMNRDLTVSMVQTLVGLDLLPGKGGIKVLDGLCGTGIRGMRLLKEVEWGGKVPEVHAVDRNLLAIEAGKEMARTAGATVEFHVEGLQSHLYSHRYSYIDIDPYGSPLPFVQGAISSVIPGGTIAFTATDTAALCGSNRRVALRRYGANLVLTEYMKEISCRVLANSVARAAASMDLAMEPLFFFASDHYVRGFVRIVKGAKKADEMMDSIGTVRYHPPHRAIPGNPSEGGEILGPMWLGPMEDPDVLTAMKGHLSDEGGLARYMTTTKQILRMVDMAISEHDLPPFGFDTDEIASHLAASPPPMDRLIRDLEGKGLRSARSRFCDKILRTEAQFDDLIPLFRVG